MAENIFDIEFSDVLNTLVDGAIIIDAKANVAFFNNASSTIFGYLPEEILGQNVKMLMPEPFHSKHDSYIQNYQNTEVRKIIGIGREVAGLRKDGSTFPMDLAISETHVNEKLFYIGIIRDLTDRNAQKRKFDQLQEQHFHLSRVAAMNEMGTAIAHELNQPLAASVNYIETTRALLSHEINSTENLDEILIKATDQIKRASEIIARMRNFIERGEIEKTPIKLYDILDSSLRLASPAFKHLNVEIFIDIPKRPLLALGNDIQIQQVLVNLIRNAFEAMEDSEYRNLEIVIEPVKQKMIQILIKDSGKGLTSREMDNLFTPFSSSKSGGLGVGLSISRSIISNHGGQMWAEPNKNTGSIFGFTLPLADEK
ncbi:MAG: PAS domain S-box protein [Hellea sp.]|nr:PAS domain S-box protein [Hellea sp.]